MITASPLRYPGGKSSFASLLSEIREINGLADLPIAEPFGGGAGASLSLLLRNLTPCVYVNDADPAISDFWWAVTKHSEKFLGLLRSTRVSMAEWKRQRSYYRSTGRKSRLANGFAAFYLNRCNRSGIVMNGGPIGGVHQSGKWKINARFNKPDLIKRCQRISQHSDRIHTSGMDGIAFIQQLGCRKNLLFIDPPYFRKGPLLYLNGLSPTYHAKLANLLSRLPPRANWIVTYDDCPEIRNLYKRWANIRPFSLRYTAAIETSGREILITPKWMQLPRKQRSDSISW